MPSFVMSGCSASGATENIMKSPSSSAAARTRRSRRFVGAPTMRRSTSFVVRAWRTRTQAARRAWASGSMNSFGPPIGSRADELAGLNKSYLFREVRECRRVLVERPLYGDAHALLVRTAVQRVLRSAHLTLTLRFRRGGGQGAGGHGGHDPNVNAFTFVCPGGSVKRSVSGVRH
jgi:hypothetical protein